MRQQRSDTVLVPRSNVHTHTATLGESLELIKKLNCHQRTTRIATVNCKLDSYNGLLPSTTTYFHLMGYKDWCFSANLVSYNGLLLPTTIYFHLMDNKNCCCTSNLLPDNGLLRRVAIIARILWFKTLWLFLMYCQTWVFYAEATCGRGFFSILMEFFDASPAIVPKTSIRQPKRRKRKREGGICPIAPQREEPIF